MKGQNKVVSTILKFVVIVSGTPLLARGLYTTEIGNRILRVIPDNTWNTIYECFGLEGAETTANAELVVWLIICFIISVALVQLGSLLFRRFFLRRQ